MTEFTQASIEAAFTNEEGLKKLSTNFAIEIQTEKKDISQLVDALGFALTSSTVNDRVNGTKLLSCVLAELPRDHLNETKLDFLTTFYADRLKDHHSVLPTVIDGIYALITMQQLPRASVPKLLRSFFQHTTCQSQVREDRAKLYKIFIYLTENYVDELKSMSADFIYGLINSIDGERDPRNLDCIFSFMPTFIASYPLLHLAEEMFEIFACYFPIDFNPSKSDPEAITREALADKLASCLVASSEFIEWTVALALEKLESDLIVAKLDSMELLHQLALKFPPALLEPHFEHIWSALKKEIYPGGDNADVITSGLKTLRSLLEKASADNVISHNYQTSILGVILPHLSDVNQRLFNPSTAIALVCVSGDAIFATEKILNCFLIKLQSIDSKDPCNNEQLIKIFTITAQIFKIVSLRNALTPLITSEICTNIHMELINAVRREVDDNSSAIEQQQEYDVKRAALSSLNECVPTINEENRALIYKVLIQLINSESSDLDFIFLLEQLGALYPIELQTHFIDICIRNFGLFSSFVKRKIYANLLPLIKQMAFAQRVLDLILTNIFATQTPTEVRLIAFEALNKLLGGSHTDAQFIVELQNNSSLIEKIISLMQQNEILNNITLRQASAALSLIIKQLPISEQYMIASEYLPKLNLQLESDLYVAKGLLGYLHQEISLDDHFERLMNDLAQLSLDCNHEELRNVAHHLLCSLANKIDYNSINQNVTKNVIHKLNEEIKKGEAKAVEIISWICKGLLMRDCGEAGEIIESLVQLLDHPTLCNAAQLAFEIISNEYPELHLPIVKYLFKQKLFHKLMSKLSERLETFCEHHLNAFIYVLKATPHAVLRMNLEKIGPILFKCLESTDKRTICISLEICENFIQKGDEYLRSHLNHIIPACLKLSQYKDSMQVRVTALKLLYDITKYPTYVLLPFKTDVVLELAYALDDPKRLVRSEAVTARNSWFLIGAPNTEE